MRAVIGRERAKGLGLGLVGAVLLLGISACSKDDASSDKPGNDAGVCEETDAGSGGAVLDPEADVSIETIKACMSQGSGTGACLDALFLKYLKTHSTSEALALVQTLGAQDSTILVSCHPVAHAIGRDTFIMTGTVDKSFAACNLTCQSGCYHGAMERFLRGDAPSCGGHAHVNLEEVRSKVLTACDPSQPYTIQFQCLHGLGHALMYFSNYDLQASLDLCDATGSSFTRASCYGGVFMENIVSAMPEMRDLSESDYQYPCDKLADKYKDQCYLMQTSRMFEMGLTVPQVFEQCRLAGGYQYTCMASLGRDLSNDARAGNSAAVAAECSLGVGPERESCTRGVAYALADNTWDGQYALPFCTAFSDPEAGAYCFEITTTYLKELYGKTAAEIGDECARFVPGNTVCTTAAAK